MALEFKVYERQESTLDDLGTLASTGAKAAFIPKNLLSEKRVVLVLEKGGKSTTITCSSAVSDTVRQALRKGVAKDTILGALGKLKIFENEDGAHYLGTEGAGTLEFFDLKTVVRNTVVDYTELIA